MFTFQRPGKNYIFKRLRKEASSSKKDFGLLRPIIHKHFEINRGAFKIGRRELIDFGSPVEPFLVLQRFVRLGQLLSFFFPKNCVAA